MSDIVNLNRFRKMRQRAEKEKTAEANRVKFGRSKAERETANAEKKRRDEALDGKKLSTDGDES